MMSWFDGKKKDVRTPSMKPKTQRVNKARNSPTKKPKGKR